MQQIYAPSSVDFPSNLKENKNSLLKHTVLSNGMGQTDRRTDRRTPALHNDPRAGGRA